MSLKLFEHNEQGYKCLLEMLEDNKCAVINHATGTGKSFIALKYLAEHQDKKALYLAPTYPILDQLLERDAQTLGLDSEELNVDTMIYRTLLDLDMKELYDKYDVFIFDEYHRTGATKTNKKLKELKAILDASEEDKKFIGLTATPIRYLDNARNMTTELFDNNVASTKTLAEAIIEGLLPAPTYITSPVTLYKEYQETLKKVQSLSFCEEKKQLMKRLEVVKNEVDPEFAYTNLFDKYIKDGEKYIIFCSTLGELQECKRQSEVWFRHFENVKRYEVHSNQTREENKEELDSFNQDRGGLSILFAVNVLNEGVHVDKVNGVILNRKTTSPIIYLQQIGRALSTSSRDRDIKIFDLVNNFNSHSEITGIYEDIEEAVKALKVKKPEKCAFYDSILAKFKILDSSKEILSELNTIKNSITREKIIDSRIENAIYLLTKYKKANRIRGIIVSFIIKDKEVKKAYNLIFRYEDYITNNQLERLKSLNVLLPNSLMVSEEERLKQLDGYDSVYLKKKAEYEANKEKLFTYLKENIPVLEELEKNSLADIYLEFLTNGNRIIRKEIRKIVKNYPLTVWEKLILNLNVSELEILKFLKETVENCQNENVPIYTKLALSRIIRLNNDKYSVIAEKLLNTVSKINEQKIEKKSKIRKDVVDKIINYAQSISDYLNDTRYQIMFSELSEAEKSYVFTMINKIKQQQYYEKLKKDNFISINDFLKDAFEMDEVNLIIFYDRVVADISYYENLLQSLEEENISELLKSEIKQIIADFKQVNNETERFEKDNQLAMLKTALDKILNELKIEEVLVRYVLFYNKNKHIPYKNSKNEEEQRLYDEYDIVKGLLTKGQLDKIFIKTNKYENLMASTNAYAINVKERYEQERQESIKVRYLNGRKVNRIN